MSPQDRKRLSILTGVLVVVAVLSFWPSSGGGGPAPARPTPRDTSSRSGAARSGQTVETMPTPVAMIAGGIGGGEGTGPVKRDVFTFPTPTPPPTPKPPPPTPTPRPRPCEPGFIGPCPTPPPPTATPIVPPAIPYKVMGLFGPKEHLIVALEDNGRLINAREGDVLDGRFIVRKINNESVDFAFVQLPGDITRRLPISR